MVRPAPELSGLIEIRGLGIRRCGFAAEALVGLVVDLAAADAERLPAPESSDPHSRCGNTSNSRNRAFRALPLVVAALTTTESIKLAPIPADCLKGIGNHMRPSIATE